MATKPLSALLRRELTAALVLLLLVIAVYWRLAFLGSGYVWFDHYDMCQLEIPRLDFVARSIHQGHFPLWDPHVWAGLPVLGAGQPGPVYPLNLVFSLLPLDHGTIPVPTLNWLFLTMRFIAAWIFYFLCRDNGLGRLASLVGGIAFSCGGYFGSTPWLDVGNGISWTPLIFLFVLRLWKGRDPFQSSVWLGVAIGLSWLSGHHEAPLILSYAVLLGSLIVASRRWSARVLAWTGLALALAAGISAIQTLPLCEFGREAARWVGAAEPVRWGAVPYSVEAPYSLPWSGMAGLLVPSATPEAHTTAFVGLTIGVLAVLGLACRWRDHGVRAASYLGLAGLVYALGTHTPIHRMLFTALPMLDRARNPVRGLFLVTFALSFLAAFGAQALLTDGIRMRRIAFVTIAAVTFVFALTSASGIVTEMYPAIPSHYLSKGLIAAMLLGFAAWQPSRRLCGVSLVAAVVLEVSAVSRLRMTAFDPVHSVCATALVSHRDVVDRLRSEKDVGRVDVDRQAAMTTLGDLYGFDQLVSFTAGVPANMLRQELHTARTQALFGVTQSIGASDGGLALFQKSPALPRAWVAHKVLRVKDENELKTAIQDAAIDLRETAVMLMDVPELERCEGAEPVAFSRPNSDSVALEANLNCRGLVVLSDVHYPGWKALLDGAETPIYEAYGSLRAVVAPRGKHRVEMRYEPASVRAGMVLTLTAAMASLVLLGLARRTLPPNAGT